MGKSILCSGAHLASIPPFPFVRSTACFATMPAGFHVCHACMLATDDSLVCSAQVDISATSNRGLLWLDLA